MTLEDLKTNQNLIRDNLKIQGPGGAKINPVIITVETRVVNKGSDQVYKETIEAFNNAIVSANATINGSRITVTQSGQNNCYWLPWGTGKIYMGQLGNIHDFFFTFTINGCGVIIGGPKDRPQVAHANLDCKRLDDEANKLSANPKLAQQVANEQSFIYEQFYVNLSSKLVENAQLAHDSRIEVVTPDQYLIKAGAAWGAVFGIKNDKNEWTFFGNWGGQTRKIW